MHSSRVEFFCLLAFLTLVFPMVLPAVCLAQPQNDYQYDEENGWEINELCAGCHGESGEGGGDGEYPRLAGMPYKYLVNQLRAFQNGERAGIAMAMYATERELPGNDLLDISNYLAGITLMTQMPHVEEDMPALEKLRLASQVFNVPRFEGDMQKGEEIYSRSCAKCHGIDGEGKGSTPQLIGQYTEYLRLQIEHFQNDIRESRKMEKYIMPLTSEDIEALLAYLSVMDDSISQ